jgi:RHS repeat-associated protein
MSTGPAQTLGQASPPRGPENSPSSPGNPSPGAGESLGCSTSQNLTPQQSLPPEPTPNAMCGNPINAATGNKFETETDFIGGTQTGLEFIRYYNSQDTAVTSLGARWRTTWHRSLLVSGTTVTVTRADGHQDAFTNNGGVYSPYPNVTSVLTATLSNGVVTAYQVTTASDAVEIYNANGQFVSLTTRAGLTTTLAYDTYGNLRTVTGPFAHTLSFTIDANLRIATMTVPDGGVYAYAYDAFGNLITVTHPDGSRRTYVYGNATYPNFLTGIIDENGGSFATWTYDTMGRAITSQHAGGVGLTTVTYSTSSSGRPAGGRPLPGVAHAPYVSGTRVGGGLPTSAADATSASTVTDANGATHTYNFATQFGVIEPISLTGVPVPSLGGDAFSYDTNGFLASLTDYDGNVTTYTHDARGDETSRTLGYGTSIAHTISTTWLSTFHLPTQIVDGTRTFSYAYDTHGNLTSKTISAPGTSSVWSYTYNAAGQALTARDPRGYVTSYGYDAKGGLTSITNPLGQVTTFTSYDADGRPLSMTDPNGLVTTLTYNWRGQVTSRVPTTWVTTYAYDAVGQLTKLTRPDGSYLAFTYDASHRLIGVADALGNRIAYTLDLSSNLITEQAFGASNNQALTHSFTYDLVNRLVQSIGAQGQKTTYGYDANSNLLQIVDPHNDAIANAYDALNRLTLTTDANGGVAAFGYDPQNRPVQVTDPRRLVTGYGYNGLDEPTSIVSPDSGTVSKTYDAAGNVATSTDARGKSTTYSYDALNRLTRAAYADGTATAYAYDQGADGIGRLTSMTDTTGTTAWTYEIHGLVTGKTQKNGAATLMTTWAYDTLGRLASLTYPSGAILTYAYNANGQVAAINCRPAGSTVTSALLAQIAYRPFGPVGSWLMGNGASYVRTFDQDGRIAGLALPANHDIALVYDPASRITSIAETGLAAKSFRYDKLNRLTGYTYGPNSEAATYDADGNRALVGASHGFAPVAFSQHYVTDPKSNRLLAIASSVPESVAGSAPETFAYDASGNTVADAIWGSRFVYAYDAKNRLASAANGPLSLVYGINGLGQRVSVANTSTSAERAVRVSLAYEPPQTYFVYDGAGHLIGQYDGNGAAQQETVWLADLPVATIQAGTAYYTAPDHLGAPHQITDASQNVVWFWDHDPFGNGAPTGTLTYALRFPGQFYDPITGLYYNGFRDYDPATGRYIESDPIGLWGGVNTYAYVGGNPLASVDRYGLDYQGGFSFGGTLIFPGGGLSINLIYATNFNSSDSYRYIQLQVGYGNGIGAFAGWGGSLVAGQGDAPTAGFATAPYAEADVGRGVAFGISGNMDSCGKIVGNSGSFPYKGGAGVGGGAFYGSSATRTYVFPSFTDTLKNYFLGEFSEDE